MRVAEMKNVDEFVSKAKRDRSPSFPFIGLGKAVSRTQQFYEQAKRFDARIADAAKAWELGATSSATLQTAAALLAYGLLEDSGSSGDRKLKISDLGFKILVDQRPGEKEAALSEAALKPKLIAEMAEIWKDGRPADALCISELRLDRGFSEESAEKFLKVFDDTIQYTKRGFRYNKNDTTSYSNYMDDDKIIEQSLAYGSHHSEKKPSATGSEKIRLSDGERELTTGLLSKDAGFRLIVYGHIGKKEIDRLISKLELDRDILGEPDEEDLDFLK